MATQRLMQGTRGALSSVASAVIYLRVPFDCTLTHLVIYAGATVGGATTFDVNYGDTPVALASIYGSPSGRPVIASGASKVSQSALSVSLQADGLLTLDLDAPPSGGVPGPVFVLFEVDDGQPSGMTVVEADGAPSMLATVLRVGNGDLTNAGGGVARLRTVADVLGQPNGAAQLDGGGKLVGSQLPALAINERFVAANQSAMLALTAERGDVAFRTDSSEVYFLIADDPTQLSNWALWLHPAIPTTLPPSGAAGGDLAGTYPSPSVEQLKGRSIAGIPDIPGFFGDDFDDNSINTGLWTVTGGVTESSQRLNIPNGDDALTALAMDMTGRYIIFKTIQTQDGIFRIYVNGPGGLYMDVRIQPGALGLLRLTTHDAGGDTHNNYNYSTLAEWAWLRVRHDNSSHLWYLDSAPDVSGVPGTWVNRTSAASPSGMTGLASSTVQIFGQGAFWIDAISSDAPLSDPIVAKHLYSLNWDTPNSRFGLMHLFGAVDVLGSAPSGPPSGWPAGLGWLGCVGNTLYMWDGSAMHSQVF
jgi:hypothetical protein